MSNQKKFMLMFFGAVLVGYGSDLAPHYLSLFSAGNLRVLGTLDKYEVPCRVSVRDGKVCKREYLIPASLFRQDSEMLGLGIIVHSSELICVSEKDASSMSEDIADDGRIASYLNNYITVDRRFGHCSGDIIVRNWVKPEFPRFGFSQAPLIEGTASWVERVKKVVELFQGGVALIATITFSIFYFGNRSLQKLTGRRESTTIFDRYIPYILGVLNFGFFFDLVFPVSVPFSLVQRLSNFCGFIFIWGSVFSYASLLSDRSRFVGAVSIYMTKQISFGARYLRAYPLFILGLLIFMSPKFSEAYPPLVLGAGLTTIILSLRNNEVAFGFLGAAILIDGLKMHMVPFLPASRVSMLYLVFFLGYRMVQNIRELENDVRTQAHLETAVRVAHDIRSPVGALKNILPMLSGDEEVKALVQQALQRVIAIADDLLKSNRESVSRTGFGGLVRVDLVAVAESIVREKTIELAEQKNLIISYRPFKSTISCHLDPEVFGRLLSNIINNSAESIVGGSGYILIESSIENEYGVISVSDNGAGIHPAAKEFLLRGSNIGISSKEDGYGVGLKNISKVLRSWGGQFEIASVASGGTCLTLRLPIQK